MAVMDGVDFPTVAFLLLVSPQRNAIYPSDMLEVFGKVFGVRSEETRMRLVEYVDRLFTEADLTFDGTISFKEFQQVMNHTEIDKLLSIAKFDIGKLDFVSVQSPSNHAL